MDIYLDQEIQISYSDDEIIGTYTSKITSNSSDVLKRFRDINTKTTGITYFTPSVEMYHEAKDLYILGSFKSSIMVCRSAAEYLAFELFYKLIPISGDEDTIENIAYQLDFRKVVNDFLFRKTNPLVSEKTDSKKKFNDLYEIGNNWIHPKKVQKELVLGDQSKKALGLLKDLINFSHNVFIDYTTENGFLKKRSDARPYKRDLSSLHNNDK